MTNKEEFLELCKCNISRDGIDDLLTWLDKSDFYSAPASTKYHGCNEGGLLEHSLNVYRALKDLVKLHKLSVTEETIAIIALFHDTAKVNLYQKGVRNVKNVDTGRWETVETYHVEEKFPCGDHADKSIIILQNFIKLKPEEIMAIAAHMGGWTSAVKGGSQFVGKIFESCPLAVLLHIADLEATYLIETRGTNVS